VRLIGKHNLVRPQHATRSQARSRNPNGGPRVYGVWAFTLLRVGDTIGIVTQSAILIGLYTRQTAAWRAARWLAALGAVLLSIALALSAPGVMSPHGTKLWVWAVAALQTALAWWFFCLLGRSDSRLYFNAPRKT
jgi:hypothetical protein